MGWQKIKNKAMKTLTGVLIFFTMNTFAESTVKSTFCSVENIFKNRVSIGSSLETTINLKTIEVKDQKIYGLFTPHLATHISDPIYEIFPLLFKDGEQQREAYEELKAIVDSNLSTVILERADVFNIIDLLSSDGSNLKWIGVEFSKEGFKENSIQQRLSHYKAFKPLLEVVLTPEEAEDILYLMYDAYIVAMAEHPELFQGIEFVPLDSSYDERITNLYIEGTNISEYLYSVKSTEDVNRVETIAGRAIAETKKISQQTISDELNNWRDRESRTLVARFFEIINQLIEDTLRRDQVIASNTLRQSGNGLILLGSAHAEGVARHLLSACKDLQ